MTDRVLTLQSKRRKMATLQRRMAWLAAGIEAFPEASGSSHAFAEICALMYALDLIDADMGEDA